MAFQKRALLLLINIFTITSLVFYRYIAITGPNMPAIAAIFTVAAIFTTLITACLLLHLFSYTYIPSLAVLGCTYLYASLINMLYLLVLPKVFTPYGLFNLGLFGPSWFWIFLQIGYPFGILLYVLINERYPTKSLSPHVAQKFLILLLASTFLLVMLLSFIVFDPYYQLPNILNTNSPPVFVSSLNILILSFNGLMVIYTLLILDSRSTIHLWLRLNTLTSFINVIYSLYSSGRYSMGWYISRVNGLLSAFIVLCAVLYESNKLHTKIIQKLRKQNKNQDDFLSLVTHEIRTGLTGIMGFSEMIHTENLDTQMIKEYAENISIDAVRLCRLVNDLLNLEDMKSASLKMNREQVEINHLIQEIVCHTYSPMFSHQIQFDLDMTAPPIWGDRQRLIEVIINLLDNALKYSPKGGIILISSKRVNDTIQFFVCDHGIGIPQEKLERIFEHSIRTSNYIGGTGLGLPIVRQIVQMHQGRVWAESTLGKGSTFYVVLPIDKNTQIASKTI